MKLSIFCAACLLSVPVFASPIVVNNITWTADQGTKRPSGTIAANRSDLASAFDIGGNFFSLGFKPNGSGGFENRGGSITGIATNGFIVGDFELWERTNSILSTSYPEAVEIRFSGSTFADTVFIFNQQLSCTAQQNDFGLVCSASYQAPNNARVNIVSGLDALLYTTITITDLTASLGGTISDDGFDVDYIKAQATVPEPGTYALVGAALLFAGLKRRRVC